MQCAYRSARNSAILAGIALLCAAPAFSQVQIDLYDGNGNPITVTVGTKYNKALRPGPAQKPGGSGSGTAGSGLSFYTGHYTSFGKSNPFNIVGTDPALGAATTTISTVIVPVKVVFTSQGNLTQDGTNQVAATLNSPIFLTADYTTGGTDVGVTQYGDAIQRSEFWNLPGFSQAGYHVLLGTPTIAPTLTINVNSSQGTLYALLSGGRLGVVQDTVLDAVINGQIASYGANVMPIFLTDNVFESSVPTIGGCCVLGYHNSEGPPIASAHTWIYAAFTDPGTFHNDVILDVQPLSHEVAEWLNDPFVGAFMLGGLNFIPPAILPGTGGACIINFETGDPLESPPVVFTKVTNGTTYHLQDEVFLPWYLHTTPSFSVNGFYTYLGTFPTFSTLCGAG